MPCGGDVPTAHNTQGHEGRCRSTAASLEERARRRCRELEERGTPQSFETVLEEMRQRDYNDSHRAAAPLRKAEDAVLLDTTELDFGQSREALLKIIRERTAG